MSTTQLLDLRIPRDKSGHETTWTLYWCGLAVPGDVGETARKNVNALGNRWEPRSTEGSACLLVFVRPHASRMMDDLVVHECVDEIHDLLF